jgi:hypothetical protein
MDEVRSIRITKIHQCFSIESVVVRERNSGIIQSDPLEEKELVEPNLP